MQPSAHPSDLDRAQSLSKLAPIHDASRAPPLSPTLTTSSPSGREQPHSNTNPGEDANSFQQEAAKAKLTATRIWTGISACLHVLYMPTMTLFTLGLDRLIFRNMAFPCKALSRRMRTVDVHDHDRALDVSAGGLISGGNQWNENVDRITKMWAIAFTGCMLVVPLSLALFQINGVGDNVYTRTTALSAFLVSCAGLISSSWYLFNKSTLRTRGMKEGWIEASRSRDTRASIDFWVFLTAPISCLARSSVFCLATICIVVWMDTGDSSAVSGKSGLSSTTTAVFLTMLIIGETVQMIRGMGFLNMKSVEN